MSFGANAAHGERLCAVFFDDIDYESTFVIISFCRQFLAAIVGRSPFFLKDAKQNRWQYMECIAKCITKSYT